MNIRVDLEAPITDGREVVFRSPVDCSQVTGLKVYHSGECKEFAFADAHGNNVGDIPHLFAENVVVKVILDVTTGMAFVQNADTNAYIERTFVKTVNGVGPDANGNVMVEVGGEVPPTDELVQAVIDALPVYDGSYYTKEEVEERFCDESEVQALIDAAMRYAPIDITSIENNVGTVEMGCTLDTVTISWVVNKEPVSQTVNGEAVDVSARFKEITGTFTENTKFTVAVVDEKEATDSASTSITFLNGVYYGVLDTDTDISDPSTVILSLTRKLQSSKAISFTVTAGDSESIVFALPTRYGTPSFTVGGFEGGFSKVGAVDFTNASGYTESYDVWVSDNVGLGSTTVKVS